MNLLPMRCLRSLVLSLGAALVFALPQAASAKPSQRATAGYEAFKPITGGADVCAAACSGNKQCHAWSFIMPGVTGPTGECRLRSTVEAADAATDEMIPPSLAEAKRPIGTGMTAATKHIARGSKAQEDRLQMPIEAETPEALGSIAAPLDSTAPTVTWIEINN